MSRVFGEYLTEAATVCLDHVGHKSGVCLALLGETKEDVVLVWNTNVDCVRASHNDLQEATEYGAAGLAIIYLVSRTRYTVVERSAKGTGFDYWLGNDTDAPLFQDKARLEVSGILRGDSGKVTSRIRQKEKQIGSSISRPGFVAVVEFSQPSASLVKI